MGRMIARVGGMGLFPASVTACQPLPDHYNLSWLAAGPPRRAMRVAGAKLHSKGLRPAGAERAAAAHE